MSDLEDPLYKNWVRSALSLKYLKHGIHSFVDRIAKQHHTDLLYSYIKGTGCVAKSCSECTLENLLPDHPRSRCIQKFGSKCFCNNPSGRRKCPNNFCSRFYDLIGLAHDERNPIWANTDPARWFGDHWAMAKCFLGTTGYSDKHTAVETDASGLLSIMLNNIEIRNHLDCPDNMSKARGIRNDIMHSTSFEVDDEKLCWYVDQMILVLQDKKELINEEAAKNAVVNLTKLKRNQIYISEEDVSEMRREALSAAQDGIKHIEKKTDEVIHIIEVKEKQVHEDIDAHFDKKLREQDKRMDDKNIQTVDESDVDKEAVELTAEEKDLQNYLVDLYRRDYVKVDISPLSSEYEEDVEEVYVPLKAERIRPGPNQSIDQLKDLFESGKNKFNNIFITGDAGIGKTTFCKKLISAWCRSKSKCKYVTCKTSAVFDDERYSHEENEDKDDDEYEMLQDLSYYDIYGESSGSGESENEEMDEEDKRQNDTETMSKTEQQRTGAVSCENDGSDTYTDDQIEIEKFDFLFFVSLRDTYQERSIEEIIKCQLFREKCHSICFSNIIETKPGNCLVILDGLDEWQPPSPLPTHPAVSKGLPLSSTTGQYAKITTSRPWKTEILRPKYRERDSEVKLIGIGEKGSQVLIESIMMKLSKGNINDRISLFLHELKEKNIEYLKFIPLLVKLLICIWFENGVLETSKTAIYSSIINLMVLQAEEKYSENQQFLKMIAIVNTSTCELSSCLNSFPKLVRYSSLFLSVSKFAFDMLFRRKCGSLLVYKLAEIAQYGLTEEEVYLCLQLVILSQKTVFQDSKISNIRSLSFNHKTFQDYFAAMYLSINGADINVINEVCDFCDTIHQFYEMLSILMFLGEMNQEVVYKILANTSVISMFEVEVNNQSLTSKSKHINWNVMELFMRANFHSIVIRSMDFETNTLKLLDQMHGLDILELHGVRMTHKALKELLHSVPKSENGIIFKITCLTWNDDVEAVSYFPMKITLQNLRKIDITGTDISKIYFIIGNGNHSLHSVELYMDTMTDVGLCRLINSIKPRRKKFELIVDNTTLQKSVDVSHDFDRRLVEIVISDKSSRPDCERLGFLKIITTNDPVIIKELTLKNTDLSDICITFPVSQTGIELLEISNIKIRVTTLMSISDATSNQNVRLIVNDIDLIDERCDGSMVDAEILEYVKLWCLFNLTSFYSEITMQNDIVALQQHCQHIVLTISNLPQNRLSELSKNLPLTGQVNNLLGKQINLRPLKLSVTISNVDASGVWLCQMLAAINDTFGYIHELHLDNSIVDRSIDCNEWQETNEHRALNPKVLKYIKTSCDNLRSDERYSLLAEKSRKIIGPIISSEHLRYITRCVNILLGTRLSERLLTILIGQTSCLRATSRSTFIEMEFSTLAQKMESTFSVLYRDLKAIDLQTLSKLKEKTGYLLQQLKMIDSRELSKLKANLSGLMPKLKKLKLEKVKCILPLQTQIESYTLSELKTKVSSLWRILTTIESNTSVEIQSTISNLLRELRTIHSHPLSELEEVLDLLLKIKIEASTSSKLEAKVSDFAGEKRELKSHMFSEQPEKLSDLLEELQTVLNYFKTVRKLSQKDCA
ncbi:uncharacterized protein LOC123556485 [Mercenaria mercenaria]|uniref:uncharacterized protein LOC123556485 n=1 Tax=Mercenaria mercenaria TaxID=6596 RepID=UPI00234EAD2C|nr:uncharacterized protein LOC123556485 [Mercenaria mercenaria]XP_053381560.1 uncharacterized protein LOC123556485 [Mercenaria mercenaria]XP_053381561.1 uncharacterized protein LOC123556485 [Mercenaria mercenaria]XP_053381563.1 uncharacterized protein LOC123556485 [Mercenaria mercenaria]